MGQSQLPNSLPPRLLTRKQAAEYCGVSNEIFNRHCSVSPIQLGDTTRSQRYDRIQLDQWIDTLGGRVVKQDADIYLDLLD